MRRPGHRTTSDVCSLLTPRSGAGGSLSNLLGGIFQCFPELLYVSGLVQEAPGATPRWA